MRYAILVLLLVFAGWVVVRLVGNQGAMLGVKNNCGGWNSQGTRKCDCQGKLEKAVCPTGTVCDQGTDICYGYCGQCRCFDSDSQEIACPTPTPNEFGE